MISFKKYLDEEREDLTSWLARIVILLLEATSLHAVEYDAEEHRAFRKEIRETIEKFEQTTESCETLIIAGEAVKSLQSYNQSIERFIRNVSAEKQSLINAMTESFLKLAHTSELNAQSLHQIESDLAKACQLQDVRLLKSKMCACLEAICQEAARQEERAQELKAAPTNWGNELGAYDQVTGLPSWRHAEARIQELMESGRSAYVLALFIKNLDNVNRRVGFAAGDQILTLVVQKVGRLLSSADELFRWRGPCFAVVMERSEVSNLNSVLAEATKLASIGIEKEIESEGRSLFFKASIAWTLIGIRDASEAGEICRRIDNFAALQNQVNPKTANAGGS